ncbi:uncharacterized protein DUF4236 [Kineothrix alysoides]|uniref:Uncharacterized protein DUF4236 n=1 Tax=Kineothrix alysoides TaxID=1469948 RepID=A0A4R1QW37_9FIRM|nr:DUF4236 domain-containing protein [Kineothrix alysoides]TCL57553.1 uncharacterized protein DUF4236 [Kineothrix alysoides]
MGFRFRKSIKIAPGLKLNINSKSVSVTGGIKGAHHTVSSTGKRTTSVGLPGTGLSYTTSSDGKSSKKKSSASDSGGCLTIILKLLGIILLIVIIFLLIRSSGII